MLCYVHTFALVLLWKTFATYICYACTVSVTVCVALRMMNLFVCLSLYHLMRHASPQHLNSLVRMLMFWYIMIPSSNTHTGAKVSISQMNFKWSISISLTCYHSFWTWGEISLHNKYIVSELPLWVVLLMSLGIILFCQEFANLVASSRNT